MRDWLAVDQGAPSDYQAMVDHQAMVDQLLQGWEGTLKHASLHGLFTRTVSATKPGP